MTEEENKAIEYFKTYNWYADINIQHKNVDILLNLIEKLKKENEEKTTIILAGAEKVKSLEKKIEELKNKVIKRDNDIIYLEETAEKEFLTKQEVKENYIQKEKIKEKLEELENEEKALRKDFEKHRVQLFELYKKVVLIEGYKKLLEEE